MLLSEARPRPFRQHPKYRGGTDSTNVRDTSMIGGRYAGYYANKLEDKNKEFLTGLNIYNGSGGGYINAKAAQQKFAPSAMITKIVMDAFTKAGVANCNAGIESEDDEHILNLEFEIPLSFETADNYSKEDREYLTDFVYDELYYAVYRGCSESDVPSIENAIQAAYKQYAKLLGTDTTGEAYDDLLDEGALDWYVRDTNVDVMQDYASVSAEIVLPEVFFESFISSHIEQIRANAAAYRNIINLVTKANMASIAHAVRKISNYEFGRLFSNH